MVSTFKRLDNDSLKRFIGGYYFIFLVKLEKFFYNIHYKRLDCTVATKTSADLDARLLERYRTLPAESSRVSVFPTKIGS